MYLRRAILIGALAACLPPAVPAAAQAPWPDQPAAQATAPWPGQPQQQAAPSPWSQPAQPMQQAAPSPWSQPQAQQSEPPCVKDFLKLREDAQKKASAIQAAGKRKAPPKEACNLFNAFFAAEAKLIKYASTNQASCGIPPQAIDGMKEQHTKTGTIRTNVCHIAAAGPARPAGPNLSDALSAPVTDSNNIKTGRGTFDTLTGSPLGK
jgi:hypothetical protein